MKLELCRGSGGWSDPKPGEESADAPPMQLYDLSVDIGERNNLYEDFPEVVQEVRDLLKEYVFTGRSRKTWGEWRGNSCGGCSAVITAMRMMLLTTFLGEED